MEKPITRKELYYSKILGETESVPEPITREERYLAEIAKKGTGGGGSGGGGGVTGVKGSKELSYRTGDVDISAENLGLGAFEDKTVEDVLAEISDENVTAALGYTPDRQPQKMDYTLDPAQWTGESSMYLYEIALPDVPATRRVYATAATGLSEDQINAFADAVITGNKQEDNKIVLQAVNKPEVELPILIEIGGVVEDA